MAGYIVHDQVGEGSYGETEAEIQKLLTQRSQILGVGSVHDPDIDGEHHSVKPERDPEP